MLSLIGILLLGFPQNPASLTVPIAEAAEYVPDFTSTTTTAAYIRLEAQKWHVEGDYLLKTLECESGLNPNAVGDNGTSFGIAQIHLSAHPDISKTQALDPEFAVDYAAQQFALGHSSMWTCAR